ncbi:MULTISPECIES: META domain-containing protein [Streptomyces]|uniref:META domain-containing protein n=1 Tax=Streptomyces koelreuteriae TaxID=2838015 RepID=A0ABX8FUE5_9ACTN|nr:MULTISPECIES: META domain-containing protein [Streptomyces]QWB24630.1 META domain-containing protein [Streptomyces koelreuteriae]UUA07639.1 META domain-containing protein [Streptomyces koelreuteriae]UUA15267.1 META domain-containing protein [Streptomyces sp. CRCS-T-1]
MDRQKQRMTLTAAAMLVPLMAACGSEKADSGSGSVGADKPAMTGMRWSVDSVTADGKTQKAPTGAHVTIDKGRAEGSFGCNNFGADATVDGDRVRLSKTMATEMACEDKPMAFEEALARTLSDQEFKAKVDGDRLTLTTDKGDTVRLTKAKDAELSGTKWTVTTPEAADGRAHLTFDEKKGTVSGSLGCNKVNAKATVRDGHITLGPPATTRMMCEDSLMTGEKTLLRLFDGKLKYGVDHQTLTLTSENGTSVRAVAEQ